MGLGNGAGILFRIISCDYTAKYSTLVHPDFLLKSLFVYNRENGDLNQTFEKQIILVQFKCRFTILRKNEHYSEFAAIFMGGGIERALSIQCNPYSVRSLDCASHRNHCKFTADFKH